MPRVSPTCHGVPLHATGFDLHATGFPYMPRGSPTCHGVPRQGKGQVFTTCLWDFPSQQDKNALPSFCPILPLRRNIYEISTIVVGIKITACRLTFTNQNAQMTDQSTFGLSRCLDTYILYFSADLQTKLFYVVNVFHDHLYRLESTTESFTLVFRYLEDKGLQGELWSKSFTFDAVTSVWSPPLMWLPVFDLPLWYGYQCLISPFDVDISVCSLLDPLE